MAVKCPACKERIKPGAAKCKHCHHQLTEEEQAANQTRAMIEGAVRVGIVVILLLFLFQCMGSTPSSLPPETVQPGPNQDPLSPGQAASGPAVKVDTSEAYVKQSAKALCRSEYVNDYSMRAACERNAYRGAQSFAELWNRNLSNAGMITALERCFADYTSAMATDFTMAGACARNQQRGLDQTGP